MDTAFIRMDESARIHELAPIQHGRLMLVTEGDESESRIDRGSVESLDLPPASHVSFARVITDASLGCKASGFWQSNWQGSLNVASAN